MHVRLPLAHPLLGTWPAGMCLDWELNWRPLGLQAGTQSTESHQPEHLSFVPFAVFPSLISQKLPVRTCVNSMVTIPDFLTLA